VVGLPLPCMGMALFARQTLPSYHAVTGGRPILVARQRGARMREFQV